MKRKKRKLKYKNILIIVVVFVLLLSIPKMFRKKEEKPLELADIKDTEIKDV